jgi:hypothetical protein
LRHWKLSHDRLENGAQKDGELPDKELEVEADGGEDGVDTVAVTSLEVIAAHPV